MNILVTGSNGQLGTEIGKIAACDETHQWFFTDVESTVALTIIGGMIFSLAFLCNERFRERCMSEDFHTQKHRGINNTIHRQSRY